MHQKPIFYLKNVSKQLKKQLSKKFLANNFRGLLTLHFSRADFQKNLKIDAKVIKFSMKNYFFLIIFKKLLTR